MKGTLLARTEARSRAAISRATEARLLRTPGSDWPRPVPPIEGGKLSPYIESEIDAWIERRIAARDAA
jgi:predicted DNA-binding transcriptional regulator AlpA